MTGTERFEYLVIANCDHCGQEVKYVEEFEEPVALDRGVSIKWARCPYCGTGPGWWDVTEEYEIERVLPTQERERVECPECGGDGLVRHGCTQEECPICDGGGEIPSDHWRVESNRSVDTDTTHSEGSQ